MGSMIEINDTLQLDSEQGFPEVLDYKKHLEIPFTAKNFENQVFEFKNKPNIRFYHMPPVRVFFVQNIDGKWLYWGLIHILSINHDYVKKTTSGSFRIEYIYTPEEMRNAHNLIDRKKDTNYFI